MTPPRPASDLFCPAFRSVPDPACHYLSRSHRQAMSMMEFALASNQAISVLTGDVGTGKTLLIRAFVEMHRDRNRIGLIGQSGADLVNPLRWVLQAFGQDDSDAPPFELLSRLRVFLERHHAAERPVLLIVDEAQSLSSEALDQLRQLADMHMGSHTLMPLFLVGDPALKTLIAAPENRALGTRIGGQVHLTPLSEEETAAYVAHRLKVAQCPCHRGAQVFDDGSLKILHDMSGGVPRIINYLAQHCLYEAGMEGRRNLDADFVRTCLTGAISDGTLAHLVSWAQPAEPTPAATAPTSADLALASRAMETMQGWTDDRPDPAPAPLPDPVPPSPPVPQVEIAPEPRPTIAPQPVPAPPAMAASATEPAPVRQTRFTAEPVPAHPPRKRNAAMIALGAVGALAATVAGVWMLRPTEGEPTVPGTQAAALTAPAPATAAPAAVAETAVAAPAPDVPTLAPVPVPTAALSAQSLFAQALTAEAVDPAQAALLYARAALRGHARSAYYLGQLNEIGFGVAPDPQGAAAWYEMATGIPAAADRLAALKGNPAPAGDTGKAPVLILQDRSSDGQAELLWRGNGGAQLFRVDYITATVDGKESVGRVETTVPAVMIKAPVQRWRVTALNAAGNPLGTTPWVNLIP